MSILFQSVVIRHERRIRLYFTSPLAAGAFGSPAPIFYTIENVDGRGPSPTVQAALIVPGEPCTVELVLADPLLRSAAYQARAEAVPALDLSVTPSPSLVDFRWGLTVSRENVEPRQRDREKLLYGTDLLFNGLDFQENALGDLETVSGAANVTKALNHGAEASGLPWDPTFGAFAREFVDSPSLLGGSLKGSLNAQILRDPRVAAVTTSFEVADDKTYVYADPVLISGESAERVTVVVPSE